MKRINTAKWEEKQKRWKINVQKDGKRKSFYSSTPGRTGQREANSKADKWLDDDICSGNKNVRDLYPAYMEDLKARTSISHWRPEDGRGRNWIVPIIGSVKISKLNDQHLQNVINNAYKKGNLAKKSLSNLRATLFAFIKYCRKCKLTSYLPEDITIPSSAIKKEHNIIQPKDLKILFEIDTTINYGKRVFDPCIYAYRLQVTTGLRPGELLGLKKSDRKGNIVNTKRAINTYGEVTAGKNDNAVRSFALTSVALAAWKSQEELSSSEYLFSGLLESSYRKHLLKYCQSNGIDPVVTPYGLRHTFVSIAKTMPAGMVKPLVGHSKDMDTFGIYGHTVDGELENTADLLQQTMDALITDKK